MAEKLRRAPMRWRKEPGGYNSDSYSLGMGGVTIAVVARDRSSDGWFSYSLSVPRGAQWNTAGLPFDTPDEAKTDATKRARAALAGGGNG